MDDSNPAPRPRPAPGPETAAAPDPALAPAPDVAEPDPDTTTRRWFLIGAGAIVIGAAAGTVAELALHDDASRTPRPAPADLLAAADRERLLIADLDATTGGSAGLRQVLVRARADHAEHLAVFEALLRDYDPVTAPTGSTPPGGSASGAAPVRGIARTAAQLRTAETAAATSSARAAATASGRLAVLLASVSASESTHAALIA